MTKRVKAALLTLSSGQTDYMARRGEFWSSTLKVPALKTKAVRNMVARPPGAGAFRPQQPLSRLAKPKARRPALRRRGGTAPAPRSPTHAPPLAPRGRMRQPFPGASGAPARTSARRGREGDPVRVPRRKRRFSVTALQSGVVIFPHFCRNAPERPPPIAQQENNSGPIELREDFSVSCVQEISTL